MAATPIRLTDTTDGTSSLRLDSAVLARLVQEVRNDAISAPSAYNRMHNRHNR